MLQNYLKIAVRNLLRHKLYSVINIGGLAIGLAACLMIFLFVRNELSYDTWLQGADRLYRLETTRHEPGKPLLQWAVTPGPLSAVLARDHRDTIEASTRMLRRQFWVAREDQKLEETINLVDPGFFKVFDLPVREGVRDHLFTDYQSLIISEKAALKYFGTQSPIGQTLELENGEIQAKVVAVIKDLPANSHLNIDFLLNLNEARYDKQPHLLKWWMSSNVHTYVKLHEGAAAAPLASSIPALLDRHAYTSPGLGHTEGLAPSEQMTINLMPVPDIHLHSKGRAQQKPTGDIVMVYSFSAIALLILAIAIINFANLSTARSSLRAREIALRKTVGATRPQIVTQFLGETFLTTSIALIIAMAIVELLLPWFNRLVVKLLNMDHFMDPAVQIALVGLAVVLAISAGAHSAFNMSACKPADVLHSGSSARYRSSKARSLLTMLQFTISIGLMVSTGVIYSQISHVQNMDVGIDKTGKLTLFHMTYQNAEQAARAVQKEIEALPEVEATSFTSRSFPIRGNWNFPARVAGSPAATKGLHLEHIHGDHNMLAFFDAKLVAGRFFAEEYSTDLPQKAQGPGLNPTQGGILNETAVVQLGFTSAEAALGQVVEIAQPDDTSIATKIVGVVKDIRLRSARDAAEPMVFVVREAPLWILNAQVASGTETRALAKIDAIWNRLVPDVPLDRTFMEDRFNEYYQADIQRGRIFAYFSLLAIVISCLGLYGLASFTAERRIKEIGMRKVMGASVTDIVRLLTFQFSKPVLFANLIAWPVAWYFANQWLAGFQHRIDLGVVYFVTAGGTALVIACLTVAGHAVKTARANPVLALKHE